MKTHGVFRTALTMFSRARVLLALWVFLLAAAVAGCIWDVVDSGSGVCILTRTLSLYFSIAAFALFAFTAYEFCCYGRRYNLTECLRSIPGAQRCLVTAQGAVLLLAALIFWEIMLLWNLALCIKLQVWHADYLIETFLGTVLNDLLIPCCGILIGMALSQMANRLNAYLLLVVFVLLASPIANALCVLPYETAGVNLFPVVRMFELFPPALNWTPVYAFGHSILPYRWAAAAFWILLMLGILSVRLRARGERKRWIYATVLWAGGVICLSLVVSPQSMVLLESEDVRESVTADWTYYEQDGRGAQPAVAADFSVTGYDMTLSVGNELKADVRMTLDRTDLPQYLFTLYHGYQLRTVEDGDGNELPFTQEDDYITIDSGGREIEEIRMVYRGHSPVFYSNLQGIYLPGQFPYYPHSGHEPVYDSEQQGIYPFILEQPVPFRVQVKSLRTVYCNLPEADGVFTGETTGLTLLAGNYVSINTGGVTVVYPYLNSEEFTPENLEALVAGYRGTDALPESCRTLLFTPNFNTVSDYVAYAQFSDHVTSVQAFGFERYYQNQLFPPKKNALGSAYERYIGNPEETRSFWAEYRSGSEDATYEPGAMDLLLQYLDTNGEERGLEEIRRYLEDDTDTRPWREFFEQR